MSDQECKHTCGCCQILEYLQEDKRLLDKLDSAERGLGDPDPVMLEKAHLCCAIANQILPFSADEKMVEEQACALMHIPEPELVEMYRRLAGKPPMGEVN